MRDYYLDFVSDQNQKTQKRSSSPGAEGAEDTFVSFAPLADKEYSENFTDNSKNILGRDDSANCIVEEKIAIMMYDGGLSEEEAKQFVMRVVNI